MRAEMAALGFTFDPRVIEPAKDLGEGADVAVSPSPPRDWRVDAYEGMLASRTAIGFPAPANDALPWISYGLEMEVPPLSWAVKNLLVRGGTGCVYGESQAGKTFLLVHLVLCIAYGLPFFGRKVKQGGVIVIPTESKDGFIRRLKAAEKHLIENCEAAETRLADRAPIEIVTKAPNLSRNGSPVPMERGIAAAAVAITEAGFQLMLVAVDTLHASMGGGDEQSAADAHFVIEPAQRVAQAHHAHFLFVHHTGKDESKGARGSYAFKAAWDAEIELVAEGGGGPRTPKKSTAPRRGTTTKVRDGETGEQFTYALKQVVTGHDEDGDAMTTCVLVELTPIAQAASGGDSGTKAKTLTTQQRMAFAAIKMAAHEGVANYHTARENFFKGMAGSAEGTIKNAWSKHLKVLGMAELIRVNLMENRIDLIGPPSP